MATEYIEREAAKRELLSWAVSINHPEYLMRDDALHIIDSTPAADVAEVVRCRECKYHEDTHVTGFEHCCLYDLTMRYNDFCSYGKREGGITMDVREKQPSEKRLIDREALLSFEKMDAELCATCGEHHTAEDVIMMIKTAPTVDAVEVVRCRDCYHKTHDGSGRPYCWQLKMYLNKELDFFCKYGKRKEGDDNG